MLRVALLSRWHVHADEYAGYAKENPNVEIVKVWDEKEARGMQWARELGVRFEPQIADIFNDRSIDAVIVAAPTVMHKEIISRAAMAGKHIFTEKILAFTVHDCNAIYEVVEKNNVKLMVSLPRLMEPYFLYAQEAIHSGLVGKVNTLRCKVAHDGALPAENNPNGWLPESFFDEELCGGGAFVDFGAHPIYITNRLGGEVKHVSANLSKFKNDKVDDNSVVFVEYTSGAIGILEASFVTRKCPFILEIFGTEGTIRIEDSHVKIRSTRIHDGQWFEPQLPERKPMAFTQWIESIIHDTETDIKKEDVIRLTEMNELAAKSHQEGRRVFKNLN
ncbi:Gfo/Idh/MocA family oxidoreductase [Fodinisporobacter ferrooxydans]|uniref:Gfo/Idh/MocA family oxidoreductase n=1 Tax=Fodinisporobacter ferrooxydans TaxID=2901836 RepID=A0ABY4CPG3_9BACL|nr:Gfo/Idh/MocA family oxidoreductase [Alicyclobacillaceae bacterium MYW30-H2]